MRETRLERAGECRVMRTDDAGTMLLDGEGRVAGEHGTDRHEMLLSELRADGWRVTADGDRVPPGAAPGHRADGKGEDASS